MTEEFKKQFDALSNINKAKGLAYDLGYDESYLDGATISSPTYTKEMRDKIISLCGGEWTDEMEAAYSMGFHDGWCET